MPATNLKFKQYEELDKSSKKISNKKSAQKGKVVSLFKSAKAKTRPLSAAAREDLVMRYQIKARKIAFSILRRWNCRLDLNEVHSLVDLSLCEAVNRYNPAMGASFLTFLFYHLKGNLIRTITSITKINSVPLYDIDSQFAGRDDEDGSLEGRAISAVEVADALSNRENMLPDEILMKKELLATSLEACNKLDKLEREVLFRVFLNEEPLQDVASSLGYSRCHVSRVKKKALDALLGEVAKCYDSEQLAELPRFEQIKAARRPLERKLVRRRKPRSQQRIVSKRSHVANVSLVTRTSEMLVAVNN